MQSTLKKTAYVAVGLPIDFASRIRSRVSTARTSIGGLRDRLSDDARHAFETWVDEGEVLVEHLSERAKNRRDTLQEAIRDKAEVLKDIGTSAVTTLTEPIVPVADIDGIGPAYAERLARAGVISTRALVERCASPDGLARLAEQADIPEGLLETWATDADLTRINGVGHEHMSLLNAIGVASVDMLSSMDGAALHSAAADLDDEIHAFEAIPSTETFGKWIASARDLVS
jgi:predicted flap endonuclease-1-like 5' DNA nuclease